MKRACLALAALAVSSSVSAEDFLAERRICDQHLNSTPIPRVPATIKGHLSRYSDAFAALCEAMDKRQAAAAAAAVDNRQKTDLEQLRSLAPP